MICRRCGNEAAYTMKTVFEEGTPIDSCDRCGVGSLTTVPDVYFKEPYWDQHLGSEQDPGPKFVTSRSHKAELLKKNNLREAGDRIRGATSFDPLYSRIAHENFRRNLDHGR